MYIHSYIYIYKAKETRWPTRSPAWRQLHFRGIRSLGERGALHLTPLMHFCYYYIVLYSIIVLLWLYYYFVVLVFGIVLLCSITGVL